MSRVARRTGDIASHRGGDRRALVIELVPVRVSLLLDTMTIEGTIHVAPERQRFSDAWETLVRDPRAFIPVTGAVVRRTLDPDVEVPFMQVRKGDVRAVYPVETQN